MTEHHLPPTQQNQPDSPTRTMTAASRSASWVSWLGRRWPTALAIVVGALSWGTDAATAGKLLPLLPLVYVAMTVVRQRRLTWLVLLGGMVVVVVLNLQPAINPTLAVTAVAVALTLTSLLRPATTTRRQALLQGVAFLGFAAIALAGLSAPLHVGRYALAAGWLAHGIWDYLHHRRDQVVSRTYAEWCGVFDVLVAATLIAG